MRTILSFFVLAALAAMAAAQAPDSVSLRAVFAHVSGTVTVKERGAESVRRAAPLQVVKAGDTVFVPEESSAALVCSNDRLIRLEAKTEWQLTAQQCSQGRELPAHSFQALLPVRERFQIVDGALVFEQTTRGQTSPSAAILLSPRKTAVLEERPALAWIPAKGETAYELTVGGNVKFTEPLQGVQCTKADDPKEARCTAPYPASRPGLFPDAIVTLQIVPADEPELQEQDHLWVRRLDAAEAAQVLAGEKSIEALAAGTATRDLLLANLYARHQLYAAAIPLYTRLSGDRDLPEAQLTLGDIYLATGLLDLAERAYRDVRGHHLERVQAAAELGLGFVAYRRNEWDAAEEHFATAERRYRGAGRAGDAELARKYAARMKEHE